MILFLSGYDEMLATDGEQEAEDGRGVKFSSLSMIVFMSIIYL